MPQVEVIGGMYPMVRTVGMMLWRMLANTNEERAGVTTLMIIMADR